VGRLLRLIRKYTVKTDSCNYECNVFFDTPLIKFDFTAKSQSTQRTASCLFAFNLLPFSAPLAKRAVKIVFCPWFVEDPKILHYSLENIFRMTSSCQEFFVSFGI
jgi:hypothetical protein